MRQYENLSEKMNALAQRPCPVCGSVTPRSTHFVRLAPLSFRQQDAALKKTFSKAIRVRFASAGFDPSANSPLCLHVVFSVKDGRSEKDVDNMAKLLLDAFHEVLYENDRCVNHLSAIKLKSSDTEEFFTVRVMRTELNRHADVAFAQYRHKWTADAIDLSDFLDTNGQGESD